jgi:hypothetical protein
MKFPKRVNFLLLSFLFTLNVALRYPIVQHEIGVDSFVIHILSNSINQYHYGKWILHPLSYIGLYPLSYPSAYPYLAAGVSTGTGIDVEGSIFIISIVLGLIGVFGIYFLAREIKNDDLICFIAALAFSLSPLFIRMTYWQASTRNLFIALAPACILLLLKTKGFTINRINILFIFLLLTVGTSHRLGVFMIFILIAYLVSVILYALYKQLIPYVAKSSSVRRSFRFIGPFFIILIFLVLLSMLLSGNNPLQGAAGLEVYEETAIFTGSSVPILIINLFVSLFGRIGLMLVFGLIGFAYLIWKKNKGLYDVFFIVSLIFIFPTIGMRIYYSYFFLVFFSILAGLVFLHIYKLFKKRKFIVLAILIVALIASVGFYDFMSNHWGMSRGSMSGVQYDGALYTKYKTDNTYITNDGLIAARAGAISGKSCLPIGGATMHWWGPEQLIYDFISEDDFQVVPIPLQQISIGADALYQAKGVGNVEQDWTKIHGTHCNDVSGGLVLKYRIQYSLANKKWGYGYWAYGRTYYSRFLTSLDEERYKIYDNGILDLHYFEYV